MLLQILVLDAILTKVLVMHNKLCSIVGFSN
jgi:hypothetical protein